MNPGKAPWLFKAKKMMEEWKGYKVAEHFVFTTITAFSEVLGHYMGNYPAVTIQDFALAKELFNRLYNIDEWSLDIGLDLDLEKNTRMLKTRMLFMEDDNHNKQS